MSQAHNIVMCNLCGREYKKYIPIEANKVMGIAVVRNKGYNLILNFTDIDKTPINKHLCWPCINDILNKFSDFNN